MKPKIIQQGAEAKIILTNKFIIKDRVEKSYRLKELDDKIRRRRTRSEAKLLIKASEIINCPKPFMIPDFSFKIKMPFIKGKRLSESLDKFPLKKQKEILNRIAQSVSKLHKKDIIHGDLTTSNMILQEKDKKIYFVDFGLGCISKKHEDKAVDVYLLKQALEAKHFKNHEALFEEFKKAYEKDNKEESKIIFERIKAIESRGRYRH